MVKKIVSIALSLILALTVALSFSSAPAMAAPTISTYNGDFSTGLVGVRYVNADSSVISTNLSVSTSGSTWRHHYSVPMGVSYTLNTHSTGSHIGKYISGFFSVDLETAWSTSSGEITKRDYGFEGSSNSGEGWTTGFYYNNDTYDVSVYLILDNYPLRYTDASQTHFRVDVTNNFSVNVTSQSCVGIYGCNLTHPGLNDYVLTTSPDADLSSVIAGSINSSSSINQILSTLRSISSDTALLQSVVNKMDNISGVLANLYSQLQQGNSYLAALGWALAGIDITAANGATVSQTVYDRWVSIIKDALDEQAPDVSENESQLDDANQQLADKEELENEAYEFADLNLADIDWNINAPDRIAGAAITIMAMVGDLWDQLGILQFAVTAALMVGLVTIVIGVANRFYTIKQRSETSQEIKENLKMSAEIQTRKEALWEKQQKNK